MICCSPRRTMPWSSAMRIFIGYPDEDPRSPAVGALDRNMAVKGVDTLADANQSKSIGAAQLLVADSAPEIAHLGLDESFASLDAHLDAAGPGVPGDIRERFLDDAVERRGPRARDVDLLRLEVQRDLDAAAAGEALRLELDGGGEA